MSALAGGCLCGALTYRLSAPHIDAGYCHCRLCQRSSGAPVLAWLTVPANGFAYVSGAPRIFLSSTRHQREFCADCGTPIAFRRRESPRTVDVTIASLSDPTGVAPEYHIWCQTQIPWFETTDDLPRYQDTGPDQHEA